MLNADNKMQLIRFLLAEWQLPEYAQRLCSRTVFCVCEETCYSLHSDDGCSVDCLCSSQEEADTRIILHCLFAAQSLSGDGIIVVRSPDTDVFVLLLVYASDIHSRVLFDTGTGTARRLLAVTDMATQLGEEVVKALPGFHAFTGCDTSIAFVRRGKRRPFGVMKSSPVFTALFQELRAVAELLNMDSLRTLEHFVCCMYGYLRYKETNRVRSIIFQSRYAMSLPRSASASSIRGIDLSLLPPCSTALKQHCLRASYQAFIWRHAHVAYPAVPSAEECGWYHDEEDRLHRVTTFLPLPLLRSTTALSVMHHPASGISFPRNFACLQITKTYHSHLISHMSVRLLLHHHCYHPLLLLTSTPDSKLIFSINLFLHSYSTFPPTGLTPQTPAVFLFLGHVGFNFGIPHIVC